MKDFNQFRLTQKAKFITLSAMGAFALATAYFVLRKKQNRKSSRGVANKTNDGAPKFQDKLNMERYVFNIPDDKGDIQAVVEQGGDCYAVHLNGKYAGNMWQDEDKGLEWNTQDSELEPYVWELAKNLSEAFSRKGFPDLLMGSYPEIIATNWKSSETLEVILRGDTDIEVFGTFLKDEVLNLVSFEEHLDLMVKKENEAYFIIVGIN